MTFETADDTGSCFGGELGHCPADALLALVGSYTPGLARLLCRSAAQNLARLILLLFSLGHP